MPYFAKLCKYLFAYIVQLVQQQFCRFRHHGILFPYNVDVRLNGRGELFEHEPAPAGVYYAL